MSTPTRTKVRIHRPADDDLFLMGYETETPGLVVHQSIGSDGWQITHAPTGTYVRAGFATRREALAFAEHLGAAGIAWTRIRKVPASKGVAKKYEKALSSWEES